MISSIEKKKDFSFMAPMHTILAGCKALWCDIGLEGVKTMRECCGAAGFSKYSGIHHCFNQGSPLVTLEGDSVVMNLQTARALLKNGRQVVVKNKKQQKWLQYIEELTVIMQDAESVFCKATEDDVEYFNNLDNLDSLLKWNALYSIGNCLKLFADPKYKEYNNWEKFYQTF